MKTEEIKLRALSELDLDAVTAIDEKITGHYRPDDWETRLMFYIRRDPDALVGAEIDGELVGFMLGDVRAGEFGMEEPSGWIEVLGVDPAYRGHDIGRKMLDRMCANFKERGAKSVRTLVDAESQAPLLGFFEKAGFATTPVRTLEQSL